MNRREARALVLQRVASLIEAEISNGSGWISEDRTAPDGLLPDRDIERMERAVRDIADELGARGENIQARIDAQRAARGGAR